jgi:hypothetical protein
VKNGHVPAAETGVGEPFPDRKYDDMNGDNGRG